MEYTNSNLTEDQILSILSGSSPAATTTNTEPTTTASQPSTEEEVVPGTEDSDELEKTLQEALGKKPEEAAKTEFFKDYTELSKKLIEKGLLFPFGTDEAPEYPQSEEELYKGLGQSRDHLAKENLDSRFKEMVENFSPSLQKIINFGQQGITSARQIEEFTSVLSSSEVIASLDPNKEEDQKQIVFLQTKNLGMNDEAARKMVENLIKSGSLADTATSIYPTLKKSYDDEVAAMEQENIQREQNLQANLNDISVYAQAYLEENPTIPFTIAKNENSYKQAIHQLAAKPVDIDKYGDPIFEIDKKISSLRHGETEKEFQQYIRICAFIADPDKYEQRLLSKGENKAKTTNFDKLINTGSRGINYSRQEIPK